MHLATEASMPEASSAADGSGLSASAKIAAYPHEEEQLEGFEGKQHQDCSSCATACDNLELLAVAVLRCHEGMPRAADWHLCRYRQCDWPHSNEMKQMHSCVACFAVQNKRKTVAEQCAYLKSRQAHLT